jgi:hypothetical protein
MNDRYIALYTRTWRIYNAVSQEEAWSIAEKTASRANALIDCTPYYGIVGRKPS